MNKLILIKTFLFLNNLNLNLHFKSNRIIDINF